LLGAPHILHVNRVRDNYDVENIFYLLGPVHWG